MSIDLLTVTIIVIIGVLVFRAIVLNIKSENYIHTFHNVHFRNVKIKMDSRKSIIPFLLGCVLLPVVDGTGVEQSRKRERKKVSVFTVLLSVC